MQYSDISFWILNASEKKKQERKVEIATVTGEQFSCQGKQKQGYRHRT